MRLFVLMLLFASLLPAVTASEKPKPKAPVAVSAKTVAFVTFASGAQAEKLKQQATDFFNKWKRYQVIADAQKADLVVLVGPMPRSVSGDDFDAVLAGKPAPSSVNVSGAPAQFAVFDGAEVRSPSATSLKPIWSTEMNGMDVADAGKKYKQVVSRINEKYESGGLTFQDCYMMGMKSCQ